MHDTYTDAAQPNLLFLRVCPAAPPPALLKLVALPFAECEWLSCVRCACACTCTAACACVFAGPGIIDGASSTVMRRWGGLWLFVSDWNALQCSSRLLVAREGTSNNGDAHLAVGRGSSWNHLWCSASRAVSRLSGSYANVCRKKSRPYPKFVFAHQFCNWLCLLKRDQLSTSGAPRQGCEHILVQPLHAMPLWHVFDSRPFSIGWTS